MMSPPKSRDVFCVFRENRLIWPDSKSYISNASFKLIGEIYLSGKEPSAGKFDNVARHFVAAPSQGKCARRQPAGNRDRRAKGDHPLALKRAKMGRLPPFGIRKRVFAVAIRLEITRVRVRPF
jgi:hypothetical protein